MDSRRLVYLADYGGSYRGSFIPMSLAVARTAQERGWYVEFVFSEVCEGRSWLTDVEAAHIPYRFVRVGRRTGLGRWTSSLVSEVTHGCWRGRMTRALDELLRESTAPTILHTHFSSFDVAAAHAVRRRPSTFTIWHEHSMRRTGWRPLAAAKLRYRLFARSVSQILCVAPDILEMAQRSVPQRLDTKIRFSPNAIDTQVFTPAKENERELARANYALCPNTHVLLHFGSDWLRKGGDIFVSTVKLLVSGQAPLNVHGVTVGRDEARSAVDAADLKSHITVLEPTDEIRDVYSLADVFVSPSRSEGMPLALLEALAMGIPVVASDIPGQAFVAQAGRACQLTSLRPAALAATIRNVLALTDEERVSEKIAARQWIIQRMDLKSWANDIVDIYEETLRDT